MAQSKEVVVNTSTESVNQGDCLVFASNLYNFTMTHPDIKMCLPPPVPEESEALFTENIGKAVISEWRAKGAEFRTYDEYNLKLLLSPNMQKSLHNVCRTMLEVNKNIFSAMIYMSAFLMDIHIFLYRKNYEGPLKQLPALWTDIFQTHYASEFFSRGGWFELMLYSRDGAETFDSCKKYVPLKFTLNMLVISKQARAKSDRAKEFRLFVVQRSLEILNSIYERIVRGEETFHSATTEVKELSELVRKVVELCKNLDTGKGDIDELNEHLRHLVLDLCVEFYRRNELTRYLDIVKSDPWGYREICDPSALFEDLEKSNESPPFFTDELNDINLQWLDEIAQIRRDLRHVMPPGTDESNIDIMLDDHYTSNLLNRLGIQRVIDNALRNVGMTAVTSDLKRIYYITAGYTDRAIEYIMLLKFIKMLVAKEKSFRQTLPKAGPSSVQSATPQWTATGGARPKSTLSSSSESTPGEARVDESSKSTLEPLAENLSLNECMKDLSISAKKTGAS